MVYTCSPCTEVQEPGRVQGPTGHPAYRPARDQVKKKKNHMVIFYLIDHGEHASSSLSYLQWPDLSCARESSFFQSHVNQLLLRTKEAPDIPVKQTLFFSWNLLDKISHGDYTHSGIC